MKDIAIFGLGRLGRSLALTYSKKGGKVIVIDRDQDRVDEIADYVTYAVKADAAEENVVKSLGIENVDVAIIAMGDNFEASIIATTICKEMGVPYIITKARSTLQGNVLKKIGADEIIYPEIESGRRIANNLLSGGSFLDIADLSDNFSIIQAKLPKQWIGKNLIELDLRKKYGFNVIAKKTKGGYDINIDANKTFDGSEEFVVIGENYKLEKAFGNR